MPDQHLTDLFRRYREHADTRALGELFDALSPELPRVARHVAPNAAEAEDLVQATFLSALERPERFDPSRPISGWLMGILAKEAQLWRRRSARTPDAELVTAPRATRELHERPEVTASAAESGSLLTAALERLPARYREVLQLHLRAGKSPSEIARERNASPATVRVQLHRGLARLRQLLPAGMAGGLVLALSERGQAALRRELLEHARHASPAAPTAAAILTTSNLGALLMLQRIGLGALAQTLVLFAVHFGRDPLESSRLAQDGGVRLAFEQATAVRELEGSRATSERSPAARPAQSRSAGADLSSDLGALRVRTVWSDGRPAARISFQYSDFTPGAELRSARTDAEGLVTLTGLAPGQYALYGDRGGHATGNVRALRLEDDASAEVRASFEELAAGVVSLRLEAGTDVRGRVLDPIGRPVADAEVWITTGLTRERGIEITRSAADGSFLARQLTSACILGARADGHAPSAAYLLEYFLERSAQAPSLELDLQLGGPDARLEGLVFDPEGRPLAGAVIRVGAQQSFDSYGPTGTAVAPPPLEVRSDEHGRFRCRGLEPGRVELACRARGFPLQALATEIAAGGDGRVEVRLERGAWVRGRITSASGTPLEHLDVRAHEKRFEFPNPPSSFDAPHALTDAEGRFELGPLAAGEVRLSASTPDRKQSATTDFQVAPDALYEWNPSLEGLPTIAGKALDVNGAPLGGWTVVARSMTPVGPAPRAVFVAADGSFELVFGSGGVCRLELYAPEPESDHRRTRASAPRTWLDGIPSGSHEVRLVLNPEQEPTAELVGRLVPPAGGSTPRILLSVHHAEYGEVAELELEAGASDFVLSELPSGMLALQLEPEGLAPLWRRSLELSAHQRLDLGSLVLERGGDLRIELARSTGQLPQRVSLDLRDRAGTSWYLGVAGQRYERRNLPPGLYTLEVQAEGCGPYTGELEVRPGELTRLDVTLRPGGPLGILLGAADGGPLEVRTKLTVTTGDGQVLFDAVLEPAPDRGLSRWLFAPNGPLKILAESSDGRRAERSLEFQAREGADRREVLRLE